MDKLNQGPMLSYAADFNCPKKMQYKLDCWTISTYSTQFQNKMQSALDANIILCNILARPNKKCVQTTDRTDYGVGGSTVLKMQYNGCCNENYQILIVTS